MMESLIQTTAKGDSGQHSSSGEELEETYDESNHVPHDVTSAYMCPPIQNSTHKVEKSDEEPEVIQGPEAIKIVKEQISQILVSKYVKQDDTLSDGVENRSIEPNPILSVKQQISNLLMEKYADQQKSISPERNTTETITLEKSIPEIEIHIDPNACENGNCETSMKANDSLNSSENLIEGYTIPDFEDEVDEQTAEVNKKISDNDNALDSHFVKVTNPNELAYDESEDKAVINEMVSSIETNVIVVTENAVLPPELNKENATFHIVDEIPFDESNLAPDLISEEETVDEQDIKLEVQDSEAETQRKVSGPATKVTLDLNTISTLSNIWDKSYRNEKWPKKTKQQIQSNNTNSDVTDSFQIVPSTSLISEAVSEELTEYNIEAKGIHNLQISESLKLKLMNLSTGQTPNTENEDILREHTIAPESELSAEPCVTNHSATDAAEPEGIENLRISESLKLKLLNIKNMKNLSKSPRSFKKKNASLSKTGKAVKPKSRVTVLTTLKRKVGRPRKNILPTDTTNEILEQSLTAPGDQDQCSTNIDSEHKTKKVTKTKIFKRKVGRPKLQKAKHIKPLRKSHTISSLTLKLKSNFKHPSVKSKSKSLSAIAKEQTNHIITDNGTTHSNKTTNQIGQKRKVGRPPKSASQTKIKEVDKDRKDELCYNQNFNLKPCFVKLTNVDSNVSTIQENGLKVNTTVPAKIAIKKGVKKVKKKPGRPKKSVQIEGESELPNNQTSTDTGEPAAGVQAPAESEDFVTNKTAEVFTKPKPGKPKKTITGKTTRSVKVSLKSKIHVKGNIKSKPLGQKKISSKVNPKQVSQDAAQVNESTDDLSANENNTNESTKDDESAKDNMETNQNVNETTQKKNHKDTPIVDWEDDWQTEPAEEGDSSDDYLPSDPQSDEEYKPKKKGSSKKASVSKKPKKKPVIKVKSEPINDNTATVKIESSENTNTKYKSKKAVKPRPYTYKGPRIGRPPVLGEFPCKYCDFVTYEKNLVQKHYSEVHRKEWMKCEYCDYSTRSKNLLLEHEGKNHTNSKPFKCEHEGCAYASNIHTDYQRHISQAHTEDKPYHCTQCDYTTRWKRNLRHHALLRHNDIRNFVCNICNRAFKRKTDLKQHMVWHSDEKPLQCDICGFRCKTNWEIKSHSLSHSDIRKYPCTFPGCTQACKTKSDLTKHMVRHKTERDFQCSLCPNSYKCKASLRKHIQYQHTSTRNFHCEKCGKSFKTKSSLRKHDIIHSDARPFYCDICGSGHTTKNNMETHKLTHRLNELPYHCPICPFGTKLPNALLAHIGAAHGDSYAYYCELCRKPFKRYAQLRKHYSRMHSEEDYKKLGHPFEIDLALMKMEMELDLDDTFESVGVSTKKKGPINIKKEPFDAEFQHLEEDMSSDSDLPDDEEFEAMERELNNDSELPHDIRKLKKARTEKSEATKDGNVLNVPKKRGRPKKSTPVETVGLIETRTTLDNVELNKVSNSAAANFVAGEKEIHVITENSTETVENVDKQIQEETDETKVTDQQASNVTPNIQSEMVSEKKNIDPTSEPVTNSIRTFEPAAESFTTVPDIILDEQVSGKSSEPDTASKVKSVEIKNAFDTPGISRKNDSQIAENRNNSGPDETLPEVNMQENMPHPNIFRTDLNLEKSASNKTGEISSDIPSDSSEITSKQREAEIASLLSHYCKSKDQMEENVIDTDSSQSQEAESKSQADSEKNEQNSSTEPDCANMPHPFFFNKTEEKFQATIALYDGFRLPLATKGFAFNYDKIGTKPKSWFMDPSNMMDPRARERQLNFMRLEKVRAKIVRRAKPVYKDGKKAGRAFGYKFAYGYNYKNAKMVKFLAEKKKQGFVFNRVTKKWVKSGEEENLTMDELKQIQTTPVYDKQKRRASFKGNYAVFENLDNLTMNEVQQRLPVAVKEESEIPKKKRKIANTNKELNDVKKKGNKEAKPIKKKGIKKPGKRKQAAEKTKPILLYSERKKPTKAVRIRKPGFLGETNDNNGQEDVSNVQGNSEMTDLLNVPVESPQKRKPGRKPKDPSEKKLKKKTKARTEPVQPKYKYVKRSQQKKQTQENGHAKDNQNTISDSVKTTKRKNTAQTPGVKKAKTNAGKKVQVKFTRNPKQTKVNANSQLSVSSRGMLHEAVAGSNLVRVHLPQSVRVSDNERIAIPGILNQQQAGPFNVDMRQVIQGGKCLMYCDDVVVMKDLSSSQEIFGLGVNQIKSETFIEPVEPFSENQVFNTGAIVNPVHPILLTQNPVSLGTGISEPDTVTDMSDTINDDRIAMLRAEGVRSSEISENLQNEDEVAENAVVDMRDEMVNKHAGTLLIKEASTDREVMQLDYSIVKEEPGDV